MGNCEHRFARKCLIRHNLTENGIRRVSPNLQDLFGRKAGSLPSYIYSDTVAKSDIIWSETNHRPTVRRRPRSLHPRHQDADAADHKPDDRADLIAFLRDNIKG